MLHKYAKTLASISISLSALHSASVFTVTLASTNCRLLRSPPSAMGKSEKKPASQPQKVEKKPAAQSQKNSAADDDMDPTVTLLFPFLFLVEDFFFGCN